MVSVSLVKYDTNGTTPLYTYNFSNFQIWSIKFNTPVTTQPLPEEGADDNVLMKLEGNSTVIGFSWTVREESTNQEVTAGEPTQHIDEIIYFFETKMSPEHLEDSYKITFNFTNRPLIFYGTINNIDFNGSETAPAIVNGSFTFYQGKVVSVYELDPPSQPLNFTAGTSGAGNLETSWTVPSSAGSTAISGYVAQRKKSTETDWTSFGVGAAVFVKNYTGLSAGTYYVRVMATNSNGNSQPSEQLTVVVT